MPRHVLWIAIAVLGFAPGLVDAADTGAVGNGNWSSAATWTNGVPGASDSAFVGSTYPNGAAATASVALSKNSAAARVFLGFGSGTAGALDLNGFSLTTQSLYLAFNGGSGSIVRTVGGTLSISSMFSQYGGNFSFASGDTAPEIELYNNAVASTTSTGNISSAYMNVGTTLSLGADLDVGPTVGLTVYGTVNANGHAIVAPNSYVYLGYGGGNATLNSRGPITANDLAVSSESSPSLANFNLTAADAVTGLRLYGVNTSLPTGAKVQYLGVFSINDSVTTAYSSATTSAPGNVTQAASVDPGGTLNLGADLVLAGNLTLNGTLNANGHAISASTIYVGSGHFEYGGAPPINGDGLITASVWNQGAGAQVRLNHAGDVLGSLLVSSGSTLTMGDLAGQTTGLTVSGQAAGSLSIDSTSSDLVLEVNGQAGGWVFRWADPTGGDHIGDLQGLVNAGELTISPLNGGSYSLSSDGSYTYINVIPAPEPSTLALVGLAATGLAWRRVGHVKLRR